MVFTEVYNYVIFDNPVSKTLLKPFMKTAATYVPAEIKIVTERVPLWELAGQQAPIIRIAGISGAAAVMLGAYGSHRTYPKDKAKELKLIFHTGSSYHFIHTLALFGTPMCRNPRLASSLFLLGTTLFLELVIITLLLVMTDLVDWLQLVVLF